MSLRSVPDFSEHAPIVTEPGFDLAVAVANFISRRHRVRPSEKDIYRRDAEQAIRKLQEVLRNT